MTIHDDDNRLRAALDACKIQDRDNAGLLDAVLFNAAATPQQRKTRLFLPVFDPAWRMQVAMLACLALLGYWGGNALAPATTATPATQISSSGNTYMNTLIFGANNWKEIIL
ncbi:MAG: hypothetical protein KGI37_02445 [Alphaproteobacteria bacterium]|nr:hypothetical protein [Alphaproteobacteria bacterium]